MDLPVNAVNCKAADAHMMTVFMVLRKIQTGPRTRPPSAGQVPVINLLRREKVSSEEEGALRPLSALRWL